MFPCLLLAQEQKKKLLIIPISKSNIRLSSLTEKNIAYNNISPDSLNNFILKTIDAELKEIFKDYTLRYFDEYNSAPTLTDSAYHLKLWSCFYFEGADSSMRNIKNSKGESMDSYHNNYYGCDLNTYGIEIIKQAITSSKCDYVLFINKFEIINPNSLFCLHVEVMDKNLNRIYGSKNELKKDISKTMYPDVLKYYIQQANREQLTRLEQYFKNLFLFH